MRITVISSGLGQPSSTRLLADRLVAGLTQTGIGVRIDVVEVRDHAHDLVNAELTGVRAPALAAVQGKTVSADALIVVTPVFNAHPAGLLQMFFEVLDEGALAGKPVLLGATGGTARHSLVLDQGLVPIFHYLHALVAPVSVFAATDDWGGDFGLEARIGRAVEGFLPLLGVRTQSVADESAGGDSGGPQGRPPEGEGAGPSNHDPLALTTDFEQMMRALGH